MAAADLAAVEAPASEGAPATLTRQEIAELTARKLTEEWSAAGLPPLPTTATVLGELYATSYGLSAMLDGFDELGGMPGFGKIVRGMFSGRRRRGKGDDDGGE